jgi:hypothetical protein
MNHKKWIFKIGFAAIGFITILCSAFVRPLNPIPVRIPFSQKIAHVEVDNFGNIYAISQNEIIKYNANGIFQKQFSTKRYGNIEFVDAMNPLKILLYYKDFQQILFLDNQLTPSSTQISLEKIGYEQASLVCASANNSFWIFDTQNNELLKFDAELKPLIKTGNLKRLLDIDIKPNFMQEHNNYLFLNCPNEGILVFDTYGTYSKTIPLKGLKEFNVINGNVFYFENHTLKEYQSQTFETIEKNFPDTLIHSVFWQNNHFYKVYPDSLIVE